MSEQKAAVSSSAKKGATIAYNYEREGATAVKDMPTPPIEQETQGATASQESSHVLAPQVDTHD